MSIRKMTDDLNIISSLSNRPTETSEALKAKFDEAGNLIKTYLNDILTADTEKEIGEKVSEVKTQIEGTIEELKTEVEGSITKLTEETEETLTTFKSEIEESLETTLSYSGFEITSHAIQYSLAGGASRTATQTISKDGYFPLGIVGEDNTSVSCDIRRAYLSTRNSGSAVCSYSIHNEDYGNSRSGTYTYYVLWAKIS